MTPASQNLGPRCLPAPPRPQSCLGHPRPGGWKVERSGGVTTDDSASTPDCVVVSHGFLLLCRLEGKSWSHSFFFSRSAADNGRTLLLAPMKTLILTQSVGFSVLTYTPKRASTRITSRWKKKHWHPSPYPSYRSHLSTHITGWYLDLSSRTHQ